MIEVNVCSVGSKCSKGSIYLIGYFCTMQPFEHIEPFESFQQVFQSSNYPLLLFQILNQL